jgi:deoxyribodipyrimidine photo-lyase
MVVKPSLVWFRNDLRLADNPAFTAAVNKGGPVIPVFCWAPDEEAPWQPGAATRWWLHHSLGSLEKGLGRLGLTLIIRHGATQKALLQLAKQTGADAVFWNRRYEPAVIARDAKIKSALQNEGLAAQSFDALLLIEPWEIQNHQGHPYRVFTAFWKQFCSLPPRPPPLPVPKKLGGPKKWPASLAVEQLRLLPKIDWAAGMRYTWRPGEEGALARLLPFVSRKVLAYGEERNRPAHDGSSMLSPHLHFGEISPRTIWTRVCSAFNVPSPMSPMPDSAVVFLKEVVWREFAYHLLFHFPHTPEQPLREDFAGFPWRNDQVSLHAWQRGKTGYPLVDAGMRQLWETGWMHNRVRMIVASFLVKHLLVHWVQGARWFWDTLVDADLASNTLGWQWTAGCGADAAPYFRIFNPVMQGEKFDSDGSYVRRWVPELAQMPATWIHKPWEASKGILESAGVRLGQTYPQRIVDHREARDRALAALASMV